MTCDDDQSNKRIDLRSGGLVHLSITHLATFLAVVQHGSMTTAAIALTYSLSTVSSHVTHLERQLRIRLLRRTAEGCEPTVAGRQVADKAAELLEVHRELLASVEPRPIGPPNPVLRPRLDVMS